MDGRITGGSVTFLKRVNRGNYEHEEASVKLDFAMNEDGTDHTTVLGRAQAEAKVGVLVQLGLMKAEVAPVAPLASAAQGTGVPQTAAPAGKGRAKHTGQTAASPPAPTAETAAAGTDGDVDPLAPSSGGAPVTNASTTAADATPGAVAGMGDDDPLASTGAVASAAATQPASGVASAASTGDDPLGSVSGLTASTPSTDDLTAQREVSDNYLQTALAKKNEALIKAHGPQGTMKIRDLMGRFVAPGKTVREIPQSDRASFLAQLEALA